LIKEIKVSRNRVIKIIAIAAILYGIITVKAGGSTLFVDEVRFAAGDYVPFVL